MIGSELPTLNSLKRQQQAHPILPKRELWPVKLIQAAVACGAGQVKLTFGMCQVRISFENVLGWSAQEILREVVSDKIPEQRALGHLVTGIRASMNGLTENLSWSCRGQSVTLEPEETILERAAPSRQLIFEARHPSRTLSLNSFDRSISHLARHTLEEYEAIRTHCSVCPIPIFLDGERMLTDYSSMHREELEQRVESRVARFLGFAVFLCLGVKPLRSLAGRPSLPYPPAEAELERRAVFHGETFWKWQTEEKSCRGAVALLMDGHAVSRIDYVLDGAVVASEALDNWSIDQEGSVAARFIIAVHPQEVGARGFSVQGLESRELLKAALPELRELAEVVQRNIHLLWPIPFRRHEITPYCGTASAFKLSMLIAAGKTLSLGLVGSYVFGGTGVVLGFVCSAWRMTIEQQLGAFLEFLEKLPDSRLA